MNQTNAVRQILMNELGLTRESIREETAAIIAEAVAKHVSFLTSSGQLERIVKEQFDKLLQKDRCDSSALRTICVEAAKKEVEKFIQANLRFVPVVPE